MNQKYKKLQKNYNNNEWRKRKTFRKLLDTNTECRGMKLSNIAYNKYILLWKSRNQEIKQKTETRQFRDSIESLFLYNS